jgi:hypothetical protein
MYDLEQSTRVESPNSRLSSAQAGRKVAICLLALLIVAAMTAWLSFLGWGTFSILQYIIEYVKTA